MKLHFEILFDKQNGFKERDFINTVERNLVGVGIYKFEYCVVHTGYAFDVYFKSMLPGYSYQVILGCFSNLEQEYAYINNVSIPNDRMSLK